MLIGGVKTFTNGAEDIHVSLRKLFAEWRNCERSKTMSEIMFIIYIIFVVALLIWSVLSIIMIHYDFNRRMKFLDEWYQQEMKCLKEQENDIQNKEKERQ